MPRSRSDRRSAPRRPLGGKPAGRLAVLGLVAALVLGGSLLLLMRLHPTDDTAGLRLGGDFHLVADTGHMVTPASFGGRYLLIYFGYTHCQDVCPTTLVTIANAMAALGAKAARVQPLFITVDPGRDTPAVLRRYLAQFGGNVLGLTGDTQAIAAAERRFHITAIRFADPDGGYDFDHTSVLILAAPDGRIIAPIRADESPSAIAAILSRALS